MIKITMEFSKKNIKDVKNSFWDFIKTTPLQYSERLSKKYNCKIYLKREDLTCIWSYKIRWSYNFINSLNQDERKKWLVCASAWNHAQWFALTCFKLKIKWTIFMPVITPKQKVYKTKQFWQDFIDVILFWDTFDESLKKAFEFRDKNNSLFVHPFDDEKIILWNSTIWLEIFNELEPDYIICPIWWWWLISWIILSSQILKKSIKIIWVEPVWASSMKTSLENWENTTISVKSNFVDWASVWRVWEKNFEICKNYRLEVLVSSEDSVCSTILEYLKEDWIIMEPAWALATDILKNLKDKVKWKKIVLIISGWNLDPKRLSEIKEKSFTYESLENLQN